MKSEAQVPKTPGKKPQPKVFLPLDWWSCLVNYCQENKGTKTNADIYKLGGADRRTFDNAKKSGVFTESTFDELVKGFGCKNREELLEILGKERELPRPPQSTAHHDFNEPASGYSISSISTTASQDYCNSLSHLRRLSPNNLPRQERSVFGRDQQIEAVLRVLTKSNRFWLVSITGVGGVGKTALALEIAHRCLDLRGLPAGVDRSEFQYDAIVWTSAKQNELDGSSVRLRLSVKSNLASIIREILRVVVPERVGGLPSEERQREMVMDLLREKRILLIVDNMEAIDDDQVLAFLREIPTPSKVIITDRRPVHGSCSIALSALQQRDAMSMIRNQCKQDLLYERLNLNDEQVENLADRTGGIPLAIIWALSQIAATGAAPSTVIRRLSDSGTSPVLDFLFKESYEMIWENSRKILAALSIPGTPVMGEMLCEWLGMKPDDVEDALDQLKAFALIEQRPLGHNNGLNPMCPSMLRYYRVFTLTREFVRNRGMQLGQAFRLSISAKLLERITSKEANVDWPSIETIDWIDENHELLAWAVEDAFNGFHHNIVLEMVRAIGYALGIRGYNDLRLRLANLAEHSARTLGSPQDLARVLITNKAWVYFFWADYENCIEALNDGLPAARESKDRVLEAIGLRLMGQIAKEQKDLSKAMAHLRNSLKFFCRLQDEYQLAITYGTLGSLNRDMKNYSEAEKNMLEALRLTKGLKNSEELRSIMCQKLTKVMIELNRLDEADEFNRQAEAVLFQLRRQVGVAYCKLNKARIAEKRGNLMEALECAKQAETLFVKFGDKREIASDLKRIQEKAGKLKLQNHF